MDALRHEYSTEGQRPGHLSTEGDYFFTPTCHPDVAQRPKDLLP
jgi:hypothetical protein